MDLFLELTKPCFYYHEWLLDWPVSNVSYCLSLIQSQISPVSKAAYRDYLGKLELQYGKLLVSYQKDTEIQKRLIITTLSTTPSIFQRSHGGSVKSKQFKNGHQNVPRHLCHLLPCRTPLRPACTTWTSFTPSSRQPPKSWCGWTTKRRRRSTTTGVNETPTWQLRKKTTR